MVDVELMDHTPNPEGAITRSMLLTRNLWPDLPYTKKSVEGRINDLWERKHFGCFEKAVATILAMKLSRSCTHQLVRHRLFSYNQLSMRRVEPGPYQVESETPVPFLLPEGEGLAGIVPPSIQENERGFDLYQYAFQRCRAAYDLLVQNGVPKEDARFIIPMGIETQIEITGNFRNWLHLLNLRTKPEAQWEIRELAWKCHELLKGVAPNVFADKYQEMWVYV